MNNKTVKALVIGYGSIGQRHEAVLRQMGNRTAVVSKHASALPCPVYSTVREAIDLFNPAYIVVSNRTSEHMDTLQQIQATGFDGTCLVEKPLSEKFVDSSIPYGFKISVGYVLRFHPFIQQAIKILRDKKLISIQSYVGQYLPDWRPDTDYRQCYSASKKHGGGVIRDLSHELDYILLLAGAWERVSALGGHFSELKIETDDVYGLLMKTENCPIVLCQMNYLDRNERRDCSIQYEGGSLYIDFIGMHFMLNGTVQKDVIKRNDSIASMHTAALTSNHELLCSIKEAALTLQLIEAAEESSSERRWVWRKSQ